MENPILQPSYWDQYINWSSLPPSPVVSSEVYFSVTTQALPTISRDKHAFLILNFLSPLSIDLFLRTSGTARLHTSLLPSSVSLMLLLIFRLHSHFPLPLPPPGLNHSPPEPPTQMPTPIPSERRAPRPRENGRTWVLT